MTPPAIPALALDLSHHPWMRGGPVAAARTLAVAEAADRAGIDAIWATEDPEGWDAFGVLGAIAARTQRALLGPGVTNPYLRHPNLLAASLATLDRLSDGRAVLGLGRGQPEWYERALGMERGDPLERLEETIALLRAWQVPPHVASSPEGGQFGVRAWERQIHPVASPPILLAAVGPGALALAGRAADGVILNALSSDAFIADAVAAVRAAALAAGRDPGGFRVVLRTEATITEDPVAALRRWKARFALVNALPGMEAAVRVPGFDVDAIVSRIRDVLGVDRLLAEGRGFADLRRGDLDAARALIPDTLISRLAIVGNAEEVRARLASLAALGVTHVSVAPPADATDVAAWGEALGMLRGEG